MSVRISKGALHKGGFRGFCSMFFATVVEQYKQFIFNVQLSKSRIRKLNDADTILKFELSVVEKSNGHRFFPFFHNYILKIKQEF